jgi:hypothetical protein
MRALITLAVCGFLALPVCAQRGGGGARGGGGGFHGGGGGITRGGGGFGGGIARGGGFGGGIARGGGGFREGYGFRGGYGGFHNYGYRGYGGWGWGGLGFGIGWGYPYYGFGYWPGYYDYYGYPWYDYSDSYPYDYGYGYASPAYYTAPAYQSPGVNIVYAPQAAVPAYAQTAAPVTHEYDRYGQEVRPSAAPTGSPIYLIAFLNDHVIRAASAYWFDGQTLHYVTLQHEERQAPVSSLDRSLTMQLNRERHVPFQLP